MEFEWDASKAAVNRSKHGITFEEAQTAFGDASGVEFYDEKHSID